MKRERWIWLVFLAALLVLLAGTAWSTRRALTLQRGYARALEAAAEENRIRRAIYKMDSVVSFFLRQESDRHPNEYHVSYPLTPTFVNVYFVCSLTAIDEIVSPQVQSESPDWITTETLNGSKLHLKQVKDNCACDSLSDALPDPESPSWSDDGMRPLWVNDLLVFARRVRVDGVPEIQGAWLDWPALERRLLADVADLLPNAALRPMAPSEPAPASRALAAIPVVVDPGIVPVATVQPMSLRTPLTVSWLGLFLAVGAVGALLFGLLRLSRRRGDFVSAVTHELRTPLTSLQLHADLLAKDLDVKNRERVVERVQSETRRLGHLVENVLAYAQLEHGHGGRRLQEIGMHGVLEYALPRLRERAEAAGMDLAVTRSEDVPVSTDPAAIEQILFNLVDNACKYAEGSEPARIEIQQSGRSFVVRDFGPGVPEAERRILFVPFHKSAEAAAGNAPGVGLGLALSRRLARQLGARLTLEVPSGRGAAFHLRLNA